MVFTYISVILLKLEEKTMENYLREPTRLSSIKNLRKMQDIFCKFLMTALFVCAILIVVSVLTMPKMTSMYASQTAKSSSNCIKHKSLLFVGEQIKSKKEDVYSSLEELEVPVPSPIPAYLYIHPENNISSRFYWVPVVLEEKISEDDIVVDLSSAINPAFSYETSDYYRTIICLLVQAESGNQPFLGQLMVAEDIVGRIRCGEPFGPDIDTILMGYSAERNSDGKLHVYDYTGMEVTEASASVQEAVDLALSGSQVTYFLLKAVTELRNEQYNLQLDDTYYKEGALFHHTMWISSAEARKRRINLVPVSFQYVAHIFYGQWLPASAALKL